MAISFTSQNIPFSLKNKLALKDWIKQIALKEKKQVGYINYVFLSDETLLKMNVDYLDHDTYTDIITFDYTEGKKISGDIFISVDRIAENAVKFKVSFTDELHRVIIHGVLHLCGYKDKKKADAELMRNKENASLKIRRF
jgi:probable rRNA maturation factor